MTELAEYTVTVVLANGDERRVVTVQLPAAGVDLAAAAGHELADSIVEATCHEWILADFPQAVTAAAVTPPGVGDGVHLPPRFAAMSRMVGEVLAVDEHGQAEVHVADRLGSYGCFYVPAAELRACTHISQAEFNQFLAVLGEALHEAAQPPGAGPGEPPPLLPGPDEG